MVNKPHPSKVCLKPNTDALIFMHCSMIMLPFFVEKKKKRAKVSSRKGTQLLIKTMIRD